MRLYRVKDLEWRERKFPSGHKWFKKISSIGACGHFEIFVDHNNGVELHFDGPNGDICGVEHVTVEFAKSAANEWNTKEMMRSLELVSGGDSE